MMAQATKEKMEMKEKISQLENELLRLKEEEIIHLNEKKEEKKKGKEEEITPLQHEDYSDIVVQATTEAGERRRDADISHLEKAEQKEEEKKEKEQKEEKAKKKEDMGIKKTK